MNRAEFVSAFRRWGSFAAVVAGAFVTLGTSDDSASMERTVSDHFAVGESEIFYRVRAAPDGRLSVHVSPEFTVIWQNRRESLGDGKAPSLDSGFLCTEPCSAPPCANPCLNMLISVAREDTAAEEAFALTVHLDNISAPVTEIAITRE